MQISASSSQPRVSVAGNTLHRPLLASLAKKALGAAVVIGVLGAGQAQALVVTVDNQQWDVTTFEGTYNNNVSLLQSQEWWGRQATAEQFASAVGNGLNFPNLSFANFGALGPFFAFSVSQVNLGFFRFNVVNSSVEAVSGDNIDLPVFLGTNLTWATATKVTAPNSESVPGPLPIFGLAAAFGFSRKLRKRIKLQSGTSDICTSTGS